MENNTKEVQVNVIAVILNWLLKGIVKCIIFGLQFVIYFVDMTLIMISNLLESTILADFVLMQEEEEEEEGAQIQVLEGSKHEYVIKRSKEYEDLRDDIKSDFYHLSNNNLPMTFEKRDQILDKVDRLVVIAEKDAVKEGYKYCKVVNNRIEGEEGIYENFLTHKIFSGE